MGAKLPKKTRKANEKRILGVQALKKEGLHLKANAKGKTVRLGYLRAITIAFKIKFEMLGKNR